MGTLTISRPADLRSLTDDEIAAMYATADDGMQAELAAECDRRDAADRARAQRHTARCARRDDPVTTDWHDMAYSQYLAADSELKGNLAVRDAPFADAFTLWSGTEAFAMKYATEELRNWWDSNPRMTVTAYREQVREQREAYRYGDLGRDEASSVRCGASEGQESAGVRGDVSRDTVPGLAAARGAQAPEPAGSAAGAGRPIQRGGVMGTLLIDRPRAEAEETPLVTVQDAPPALRPNSPDVAEQVINGGDVLDEARAFIARFWIGPSDAALDTMALWAAHTHVTDKDGALAFYSTPRIAFVSDQPGSGKTAALELLGLLCPRAELVSDPTAPYLLDAIARAHATILIDEVDLLFGTGQAAKAVRTVVNTGYRRGGGVGRVGGVKASFAPVAMAGLASSYLGNPSLAPTRERSIIIHCAKPGPGVKPERYREQLHAPVGMLAAASLADWAGQNMMDIVTAWPDMPEGLDGRQEDVWMPLLAVAEAAGGNWPDRARAACLEFTSGTRADAAVQLPPVLRLLRDIRAVWPQDADRMASAELVTALTDLPGAPWGSMWSGPAMLREIPAMLGVAPVKVKLGDRAVQGYYLSDFEPLWAEPAEAQ